MRNVDSQEKATPPSDAQKIRDALAILDGVAGKLADEIDVVDLYGDLRRVLEKPSDEVRARKRAVHTKAKRQYRARLRELST